MARQSAIAEASERPGPVFALKYFLYQLLGQTRGLTKFVNLLDGGDFDKLELYELVRRRCRLFIACDAQEDGQLTFGAGRAIRKCPADFGVLLLRGRRADRPRDVPGVGRRLSGSRLPDSGRRHVAPRRWPPESC